MNQLITRLSYIASFLSIISLVEFGLSATNVKNSFIFFLSAGLVSFILIVVNQFCIELDNNRDA